MMYKRRNQNLPRDWLQLGDLLLERFGSNIHSQEAQLQEAQLMTISQGSRSVWEYASQFEMLLGCLDNYNDPMMLNQFIWGLQLDLARSVSLQYPKSIAQVVSLAETTELAVKAPRRLKTRGGEGSGFPKGPGNQNRGRVTPPPSGAALPSTLGRERHEQTNSPKKRLHHQQIEQTKCVVNAQYISCTQD